jgi:hypothetical protein
MMKLIFTFFLAAVTAFGADAANDLVLSQRNAGNTGFIQRNVAPVTNGFLTFDSSKIPTSPDITYSTPVLSVPASFGITGAGSLAFTAGGSNQNVTITPSDAGAQGPVSLQTFGVSTSKLSFTGGIQISKQGVTGAVFPAIELIGYRNGFTAQSFIALASANGTEASPTTNPVSTTVGGFRFYGRANAAWRNIGNVSTQTSASFGDSDFSSTMVIGPSSSTAQVNLITLQGGNNSTGIGFGLSFGNTASFATNATTTYFNFDTGTASRSAAFGTTGAISSWTGRTITDAASSGTVATAVAHGFGQPTFAASSATTFTNAANLYIAGDVANGTNVTLTNSYGLWNVGKTRLDGVLTVNAVANFLAGDINVSRASVGGIVGATFQNTSSTGNSQGRISVSSDNGTAYLGTVGTAWSGSGLSPGDSYLWTAGAFRLSFGTNSTERLSISSTGVISGGAGNMTITAGTGASRTLTLQTTTSGSTATTALTIDATQKTTISQPTAGVAAFSIVTTATSDDPTETVYQNRVTTANATPTTLHTVAIPASTAVGFTGYVIGRRTGGASGAAEDCAYYRVEFVAKNTAGTAATVGSTVTVIGESQAAWDVTTAASTSNILIQVTGAASNDITWHLTGRYYPVST